MVAGVINGRRDDFSGRVDDQCRYLLAKFRPQEVPWVPGGSGPPPGSIHERPRIGILRSSLAGCCITSVLYGQKGPILLLRCIEVDTTYCGVG